MTATQSFLKSKLVNIGRQEVVKLSIIQFSNTLDRTEQMAMPLKSSQVIAFDLQSLTPFALEYVMISVPTILHNKLVSTIKNHNTR
jgi:hypothetical protein